MEANIDDDTLCSAIEHRKAVGELMLILATITAMTVIFVTAFVGETAGSDLEALERRYCCLPICTPKPPQLPNKHALTSGPTPPPRRPGQPGGGGVDLISKDSLKNFQSLPGGAGIASSDTIAPLVATASRPL